jgi:hypothetical protein
MCVASARFFVLFRCGALCNHDFIILSYCLFPSFCVACFTLFCRYGLAAYACTKDLSRAWRVLEALEFGMIGINEHIISGAAAPFGGMKESGLGKEGGHWGLEEYLEMKYIGMGLGDTSTFI